MIGITSPLFVHGSTLTCDLILSNLISRKWDLAVVTSILVMPLHIIL